MSDVDASRWAHDDEQHAWWVQPGQVLAGEYPIDGGGRSRKLELLVDAGIRSFVDLTGPDDRLRPYTDELAEVAAARGVEVVHQRFTIPDMGVIDERGYVEIVEAIDAELAAGRPVFVHCWGGVGRTGTVVGAWLIAHGTPADAVLARLEELRAGTRKANRPAPETQRQRDLLRAFAWPDDEVGRAAVRGRRVAFVTTTDPRVAVDDTDRAFHDAAFAELGLALEHRGWDEPDVDWAGYDLVVIRSPWDYPERLDAFLAWLDALAPLHTLHNPAAVVRWNLDKRYLGELAGAGLPVVPTAYADTVAESIAAVAAASLEGPGGDSATAEVVVKPTVSAGSRDTGRFARTDPAALELAERIVGSGRTAMVQPAVPSVAERGELAFVVIDGAVSHAYRKGPLLAPGGGLLTGDEYREVREAVDPPPGWTALAERAHDVAAELAAPGGGPLLYARIDLVELPGGEPALLEAELFEPFLSMDLDAGAPGRFARACAARIRARS